MFEPPLELADLRLLVALSSEAPEPDPLSPERDPDRARRLDRLRRLGVITRHRPLVEPAPVDGGVALAAAVARANAPATAQQVQLRLPLCLGPVAGGFRVVDHDGVELIRLGADELWAALAFAVPSTLTAETVEQLDRLAATGLDADGFRLLAERLVGAGLLVAPDPSRAASSSAREAEFRLASRAQQTFRRHANQVHLDHDDAQARDAVGGRAKVVPVQVAGNIPPLSTGMVYAYARQFDGGRLSETYDLHPRWITEVRDAPAPTGRTTVYLFTNYLWSHERNLDFAREIKALDPHALTIHGGPDCPTYPGEAEEYLQRNTQVDIAVRGEGEVTATAILAALAPSIGAGKPDLSALAEVAGVIYRDGDRTVRTPDRPRIEDVDAIPSPYLTGVFDVFGDTRELGMAIIETNRGCPYGCTFCDWGSATNSRIRKFDLERVKAEFTWCAQHDVPKIFVADANFGIFARDVDIARHVVSLRDQYGFPKRFITNYAKNTVKHLKEIVGILAEGGVLSEGLMSLQSMDEGTLLAIRRSNIKLEKYEALSKEFRQAKMPLFVDLMMGLPGQSLDSLRRDLQQCVNREVNAKCHATELLVNSPMNDPAYRAEHQLETSRPPGVTGHGAERAAALGPAVVVASATFTRDDYREMHLMRRSYLLAENFGILRQVSRFVRREIGLGEVALVEQLRAAATRDPDEWPYLALALIAVPDTMLPPISWSFFLDDVRRYLVDELGMADGADLETVLAVQHALLPAPGRTFPLVLTLAHDFVAWHRTIIDAKDDGHLDDWEQHVDRLAAFPPGSMTVADPRDLCNRNLGVGSAIDAYQDWELDSPVARAMPGHYQDA